MTLADWFLTQIDTYGPIPVLAAEGFAYLATWSAIGAAWTAVERIRQQHHTRHLEHYANHPANRRKEDTP